LFLLVVFQNTSSFLRSVHLKTESEFLPPKNGRFGPPKFWGGTDFRVVPPLLNNTAKMSFGEDLVKICPAIAEQSRQKKKTQNAVAY